MAPFSAGTWTTPEGSLLIEGFGEVKTPSAFLTHPENLPLVTERLHDLFDQRGAGAAGTRPEAVAEKIPFLVMSGRLDTRFHIARQFAESLNKPATTSNPNGRAPPWLP